MGKELTEEKLMGMLTAAIQKASVEGKSAVIGIYGESDADMQKLAESIFDEKYLSNCVFIHNEEELQATKVDVLLSFGNLENVPCFNVQELGTGEAFELVNWIYNNLPSSMKKSFVKHQKIDIDLKEKYANIVIKQHCTASFGIGFVPIPFSDAPFLVTNEIALMGRILDVYGLEDAEQLLKTVGFSTLFGNLLTMCGKGLVAQLLKLLPGVGTIVGGLISGSTATAVTLAFGKSVSKVVKQLCKASIEKNMAEFEYIAKNFSSAVTGTAVACIESGMKTEADYEKDFDNKELSIADFEQSVEKGREFFQQFLDKNAELDNEFNEIQTTGNEKSGDMWNAISRL